MKQACSRKEQGIYMIQLLIIADDFTGALDTGVQFARIGTPTKVITEYELFDPQKLPECTVLVVNSETRHIAPEQAYETVSQIINDLKDHTACIYKKTDSALRGNIGAELSALYHSGIQETVPFIPAYPLMNRITAGGIHYIDGVPVAESVFGKDPFDPVIYSDVAELIHEQTDIPVISGAAPEYDGNQAGIIVYDAASAEDLNAICSNLFRHGSPKIMAGCAGFASVLPEFMKLKTTYIEMPRLNDQFLVICGSVNPITLSQLKYADENGFRHIRLRAEQLLDQNYWHTEAGRETVSGYIKALNEDRFLIIDSNQEAGQNGLSAAAAERGLTVSDLRGMISSSIGTMAGVLTSYDIDATILITGGDTLLQCMKQMNATEIEPILELDPGVVLSEVQYGDRSGYIISKSGGFGKEDLLVSIVEMLKGEKDAQFL